MSQVKRIVPPLTDEVIETLKAGDNVLISGHIYTGRDAAHKRLIDLIESGASLPFDLKGQLIYYVGPSPAKPGAVIGSAGPTTSYRMDPYAPKLLELGLKGMIGKGSRSQPVRDAMRKFKGIYLAATGGAAALITKRIRKMEIIAYEDLGPEAIRLLTVEDFPAVVVNDIFGNDLYEEGRKLYKR
jgi:fumarate hydratase subunit beta